MARAKVTKDVFDLVKLLLNGGATAAKVAELTHVSTWTVYHIRQAKDLDDYFAISHREPKQEEHKPAEIVEKPAVSGSWTLERIFDEAKKQTALLTAISDKLAYIVVELTGTPEGTGENAQQDD